MLRLQLHDKEFITNVCKLSYIKKQYKYDTLKT